ncbi:gamma-glutamyltransferase [Salsipaludibacter albus]|uniref:gamma-glutamyltransferase n=1 Tax=Salsipaludibacter albus TaxID=2849650 RepID=UPI001EE3F70B|nr:gamma-glutamyltransferase [Salsipaludibacter albus]MBY5163041.1 gamma-glutamyltransferase [Salsipaludibacter albus]
MPAPSRSRHPSAASVRWWDRRPGRLAVVVLALLTAMATPALAQDALPQAVTTEREMVVTANPLATAAGEKVLRTGGTAADAYVAVQAVLGLVEPQSSGLGGGAFMVWHDGTSGETTTYDAREKAPMSATEDRFAGLGFVQAWQSGLSAGVPGTPMLMEEVHEAHGRLPWQRLFTDGLRLAQGGFELTQRTSDQVAGLLANNTSCSDRLYFRDPVAFDYFTNGSETDCAAKPAGTTMRNKDYADTLKLLRNDGADGFYTGHLAESIAEAVQTDPNIPGDMTTADLAAYDVVEREPVCEDYRGHEVCGMGPPSSGALAVGQILGILEHFDLGDDPLGVEAVHLFSQAGRLAFADRNLYVADTDFVTVPVEGMLDEAYLASRAALITDMDMGTALPGTPPGEFDPTAPQPASTENGTSHVSIVDRWGNAVSVTTTIESSFGNGVMVPDGGFLLNNELTDFSFAATAADGTPIANRVEPEKRPRSSMSPTIMFDESGELELVTGSPGGSRIIGYTAQSIINVVDFGLDPQEAINVPHHQNRNGSTELEAPIPGVTWDYDVDALRAALQARGHNVTVGSLESGLSLVEVVDDGLVGGADHRRDGAVGGR